MDWTARKEATREKLIQTALQLFAEQGYEQTTVGQITQESGVAKGTFFNYFPTKEDVLAGVGQDQEAWALHRLERIGQEPGPAAAKLTALIVEMAERVKLTPRLVHAMFQVALTNEAHRNNQVTHTLAIAQGMTPIITRAQQRGELTSTVNPTWLAVQILQTYFGVLWGWSMTNGETSLAQGMQRSMQFLFQGAIRRTI